jgi:hypothetical protein
VRTPGLIGTDGVHRAVAAGLAAACIPQVGITVCCSVGDVAAALGIRGDLGGSALRAGDSEVELSAWPADRLGDELARAVPALGSSDLQPMHVALTGLGTLLPEVVGALQATVVVPPLVVGVVVWLATATGWLSIEPAGSEDGVRRAAVRPVQPDDLGAAVAPFVACLS